MSDEARNEIWKTAIMWYGVELLPVMRAMSRDELLAMMHQAQEYSLREPLHLMGPEKKYDVPLWDLKPISAAHVAAIIVFGLWVACQEHEGLAAGLMRDWAQAIKPAVALTLDSEGKPVVGFYRVPEQPQPPKGEGSARKRKKRSTARGTKKGASLESD